MILQESFEDIHDTSQHQPCYAVVSHYSWDMMNFSLTKEYVRTQKFKDYLMLEKSKSSHKMIGLWLHCCRS